MESLSRTRGRQPFLDDIIIQNGESLCEQVWDGVTAHGGAGDLAQAVADTVPKKYTAVLMADEAAAIAALAYLAPRLYEVLNATSSAQYRAAKQAWASFVTDVESERQRGDRQTDDPPWPTLTAAKVFSSFPIDRIRKLADLAGRMVRVLKGKTQRNVLGVPEEVCGVETSGHLTRAIPGELVAMGHEATRKALVLRALKREVITYQRRGKDPLAQGPLVVCVDESGSMRHDGSGDKRELWAKAAMVALTEIAWKAKRTVVVVHYSTITDPVVLRPGDRMNLMRAACRFLDGGTRIANALDAGLDQVSYLNRMGHKGADLVLITDGEDNSEHAINGALDRADKAGVRLFTVGIERDVQGPLRKRAAVYTQVNPTDEQGIEALAGAVAVPQYGA